MGSNTLIVTKQVGKAEFDVGSIKVDTKDIFRLKPAAYRAFNQRVTEGIFVEKKMLDSAMEGFAEVVRTSLEEYNHFVYWSELTGEEQLECPAPAAITTAAPATAEAVASAPADPAAVPVADPGANPTGGSPSS